MIEPGTTLFAKFSVSLNRCRGGDLGGSNALRSRQCADKSD